MSKVTIRPVKVDDIPYINEMRIMKGVKENILGISTERIEYTEEFIKNIDINKHILVAQLKDETKVVGLVGLHVNSTPRLRHSASIGIMVHRDYQGKGIGKKLMKEILDLADNWLMLKRVELGVFADNERAIKLYELYGFKIEGRRKYAAIRNGKYEDEYIMGRYNI
ncbi:GNAT family N-acetyltransferase [Tepidibacter aestuarii]|uniref:GNAT family N-acetyltransferase n=1 Tax=Tepidibacter aestuarii TaxID=2925782 RepID=UPI0020C0D3BA|nr:GNAT family N-acetyltransferase [Tepidibacter aestuarii]CAH2215186.1 putative acetyltransferase [Tepidibacter aestuarii]